MQFGSALRKLFAPVINSVESAICSNSTTPSFFYQFPDFFYD